MGRRRGTAPAPPGTGAAAHDPEPQPLEAARAIALRQLASAPRSRAQLTDKLAERGVADEVITVLLDRFEEVGLLDDQAYAEMLVRTRHDERGLARRALAQELRRKGIEGEVAEAALAQVDDDDEQVAARALVTRRIGATRGLERQRRRRRLGAMLGRRGYPAELAMRVVDEALADEPDDPGDGGAPADLPAQP